LLNLERAIANSGHFVSIFEKLIWQTEEYKISVIWTLLLLLLLLL
jgi:hypothetical protein